MVLGHIVGELDSGVSRRRNEACIGNSGTWRREPIGGVYGGQRRGECRRKGQHWSSEGGVGDSCWRGMEAVLDVGGGEGGAHGVRGVAMDVADGGVVLGLALDLGDEKGVGDDGGDSGAGDGDGCGGRGFGCDVFYFVSVIHGEGARY